MEPTWSVIGFLLSLIVFPLIGFLGRRWNQSLDDLSQSLAEMREEQREHVTLGRETSQNVQDLKVRTAKVEETVVAIQIKQAEMMTRIQRS